MALLEAQLKKGCCRNAKFVAPEPEDSLKGKVCPESGIMQKGVYYDLFCSSNGKISKARLKQDLKDLSEAYNSEQPSTCLYTIVPILLFTAAIGIVGGLIYNEQMDWQQALMFIAGPLIFISLFISFCGGCCAKRKSKNRFKKYVDHINSERNYKDNDLHWRISRIQGEGMSLMLCKGNPNTGSMVEEEITIKVDGAASLHTMKGIQQFVEQMADAMEKDSTMVRCGKYHSMKRIKLGVPKASYYAALKLVRAIEVEENVFITKKTAKMTVAKFIEKKLQSTKDEIENREEISQDIDYYIPCISNIVETER